MNATAHSRIVVLPALLPLDTPCAICGAPYDASEVSAFEMIERDGRPLCYKCAAILCPNLLRTVTARVPSWPHDIFDWTAGDQAWVIAAIQQGA